MFGSEVVFEMSDDNFSKYPTTLRLGIVQKELVVLELEDVDGLVISFNMDDKALEDLDRQICELLKGGCGG